MRNMSVERTAMRPLIGTLFCITAMAQTTPPPLPVPADAPDADTNLAIVKVVHSVAEPVTIRLEFYDTLTGEPFTIDATVPRDHAFAGYKIIKGIAPIGYVAPTNAPSGIGLPLERLAVPILPDSGYVCVWDQSAEAWAGYYPYDNSGTVEFQVPAWDRWYWIGIWNDSTKSYVYSKWIGHFLTR